MRLGQCHRCKVDPCWVNRAYGFRDGKGFEGEFCADCFDALAILKRRPRTGGSHGGRDSDPYQENAVRILEDREESS